MFSDYLAIIQTSKDIIFYVNVYEEIILKAMV